MGKSTWIGLGIVLGAVIIFLFNYMGSETTSEPLPDSIIMEPVVEDVNNEIEVASNNNQESMIIKGDQLVSFDELDEVEQYFVQFVQDFYNVDGSLTEEEFMADILERYRKIDDEVGDFLTEAKERLPEYGKRELFLINLYPEYHESKTMYILPMVIYYEQNGEKRMSSQFMANGGKGWEKEEWFIMGHTETGYESWRPKVTEQEENIMYAFVEMHLKMAGWDPKTIVRDLE